MVKSALVCGAGGFIGSHLVNRLKDEKYFVRGVDLKKSEFSHTRADEFIVADLRYKANCRRALEGGVDEVYQLAADMGGAGFVFTREYDFDIMHNSGQINLNIASLSERFGKLFYSSSACVYPQEIQGDPANIGLREEMAYPANPDSDYGFEKLFSERVYLAMMRNRGVPVRIARFHNIFGSEGTYDGGREKAPAAMCRKVAYLPSEGGEIEVWGDGKQTRSFLYIDECLEGIRRLMDSDFVGPVNIGSEEMISINDLALMVADIAGKKISFKHIDGPLGVRGRNSENSLIKEKLGWSPNYPLRKGMEKTYAWIEGQVNKNI